MAQEKEDWPEAEAYLPIENYGVIGDLHSVALVGMNGSIDWCCLPHFDSPSLFAALLDRRKGGRWRIASVHPGRCKQVYFPDTNVLITRFLSPQGVGEVMDFMPVEEGVLPRQPGYYHQIVREVRTVQGQVAFRMVCEPAFNYARDPHTVAIQAPGAVFSSPSLSVGLVSPVPLRRTDAGAEAVFTLRAGESLCFILRQAERADEKDLLHGPPPVEELILPTLHFWKRWLSGSRYRGRWREMVNRSALTLKLLTYAPTGAIVAAPTCSLPEVLGGGRNWDYRYTWIRDASFTLYALMRIGFTREAAGFMDWLEKRLRESGPHGRLQAMYSIHGGSDLAETVLDHLEGYQGSRPVRIGNGAYRQLQLDIYGEMMDSVYLYNKYGAPISHELWMNLRNLLRQVEDHWMEPDEGIWEMRAPRRQFTHSKLMCWVALDRALRLAHKRSLPLGRARWEMVRDSIYETIMTRGWSAESNSFTQTLGGREVDAGLLLMPLMKFISPNDPRMLGTLEAVKKELVNDSLVYRYRMENGADGLPGREGSFTPCTFWLVECLTRAGRLDEARLLFEKGLGFANHLGLFAEEIGQGGEALGNFPQAFTHLGLISAAYNLDRALGEG